MITHDEYTSNSTPPTWKAGMMSHRLDKKPDLLTLTTMTDEPAAVDINAKSAGCGITSIRSGWAVCRPIRIGTETLYYKKDLPHFHTRALTWRGVGLTS